MYLRNTDYPTLEHVANQMIDRRQIWGGSSTNVSVLIDEEPERVRDSAEVTEEEHEVALADQKLGTIRLGEHEVPFTRAGMQVLAQHYEIPYKFLERITPTEQQFILDNRIQRYEDHHVVVRYTEKGVSEAYIPRDSRIDPYTIPERLMERVMDSDSLVVEWWNNPDEFRLDVIVPEDYDKYIGGDRKVGDLTHGGLRIGQNRKQNLAPWVQPYLYRLACTNGMEVPDYGLKVDARGASAEDIVQMLMGEAKLAMDRVTDDIRHFYDLRTVKAADDRTGLLRRIAREQGVSDRTIGHLEDSLPDALLAEEEVTLFHLVNHVTNQANDPLLRSNHNVRRTLERAGGAWVNDHAQRCDRCHSILN